MTLLQGGGGQAAPVPSLVPTQEAQGVQNLNLEVARDRIIKGHTYRDSRVVCLIPSRDGMIHTRVADALEGLIKPMNHAFVKWHLTNMEVGEAYNVGINMALGHPDLKDWEFILTAESDNLPPPDGLLRLIADMREGPWAAVSGLYWTKGIETAQPMIYGDPKVYPVNFVPQIPVVEGIQECRGIGMGFALWDMNLFRDPRLPKPWFQTLQEWDPAKGVRAGTQDLFFCGEAQKFGYRFAVDTRVRVGHMDLKGSGLVY